MILNLKFIIKCKYYFISFKLYHHDYTFCVIDVNKKSTKKYSLFKHKKKSVILLLAKFVINIITNATTRNVYN